MLNKLRSILVGLSLIVIASLLALYMYVQSGKGDALFGGGRGSLQAVSFATLQHPQEQEGYLLCSSELCPTATPDGPEHSFNINAAQLRQRLLDYVDNMPMIDARHVDLRNNQFDFTERLPGQHLPAVVSVRIISDTDYTSKMAIYTYQPIGDSSETDHSERVERWLSQLSQTP